MTVSVNGGSFFGNSGGPNGGGSNNQGGTFDNQGTVLQTTNGYYLYDSVTLENEATYDFTGNANVSNGNFSPSFVNTSTGLVEKTGGAGTSSIGLPFNNQGGTVDVQTGTLTLSGGASTGGTLNAAAPGILDLTGGNTNTFGGVYSGSGSGTVSLSHGTLAVAAAGATFDFAPGLFVWSGGTISGSAGGALDNTGAITLTTSNEKDLNNGLVLNNSGTILDKGTGNWQSYNHDVLNNLAGGLINMTATERLTQFSGGSGTVNNEVGAVFENTGAGVTHSVTLNNTGTVDIESGAVTFNSVSPGQPAASSAAALDRWWQPGISSLPGGNITRERRLRDAAPATARSRRSMHLANNVGTFTLLGGATFTTVGACKIPAASPSAPPAF